MRKAWWSLRSALFVLWLIVTVIPWAVVSLIGSIFMRGTPLYWLTIVWLRMAIYGARIICGVRWRITGMDNLRSADRAGPIILLPKHQSTWETFALLWLFDDFTFIVKRELMWIPIFGWYAWKSSMIPIDRGARGGAIVRQADGEERIERLQHDDHVVRAKLLVGKRGDCGAHAIGVRGIDVELVEQDRKPPRLGLARLHRLKRLRHTLIEKREILQS
jgi:1-acyl-sn-glycerol-3-phosphate acyltransferase